MRFRRECGCQRPRQLDLLHRVRQTTDAGVHTEWEVSRYGLTRVRTKPHPVVTLPYLGQRPGPGALCDLSVGRRVTRHSEIVPHIR
jgi:hypothetical protein